MVTAVAVVLYYFGYVYVELSPHNTHRLTVSERAHIDKAVEQFQRRVINADFEAISQDLSKGRRDPYWEKIILEDIKDDALEFGQPLSWEMFRCAQPQIHGGETIYHLDYLTTFDTAELYQSVILSRDSDDQFNLVSTDVGLVVASEWRIVERNRHRELTKRYPRELIVPFADRYLEVRY